MELDIIDADSLLEGKYDGALYDKFVEAYRISDYDVLTPKGWINIEGIGKTIEYEEWQITTSGGKQLSCADEHILYRCDDIDFRRKTASLTEIFCRDLFLGDFIMTEEGPEQIMDIRKSDQSMAMYDLQLSDGSDKQYYTNRILSHNSLWMQNLAVKSADNGYNVLYITLEMSEKKVMKRIGSMRLKIPINDYDKLSKDSELIRQRIESLKTSSDIGSLFEKKVGKIITKFWAAGTAQLSDIDGYIQRLKEKRDIKIDLIVVDYIALIAAPKSSGGDNLYTKGKFVAEGLRALASKWKCPLITAVQLAKDAWNSSDLTLESVPESKAIVETCDTFFGIIRTPEMQRQNLYRLKMLKQRDGDFSKAHIKINLNPTYLILDGDMFIDS